MHRVISNKERSWQPSQPWHLHNGQAACIVKSVVLLYAFLFKCSFVSFYLLLNQQPQLLCFVYPIIHNLEQYSSTSHSHDANLSFINSLRFLQCAEESNVLGTSFTTKSCKLGYLGLKAAETPRSYTPTSSHLGL